MPEHDPIHWDIIGVFALALVGLLISMFKHGQPPAPVPPGPSPVQKDADKKEADAEKKAEGDHDKQVADVEAKYDSDASKEVSELEKKTDAVKDDPSAINTTLLDIGKDVRGGGGT